MTRIKLISTILFILFYIPCWAQYDEFYKVDNNTWITTTPNAELYELPYTYDLTDGETSYPETRGLINVDGRKIKRVKNPQQMRVLRLTNTRKQHDFNAYIVEYKEKYWVIYSSDVQDNSLLHNANTRVAQKRADLCAKHHIANCRLDSLNHRVDSLVCYYKQECTDSLNYYKELKTKLPAIRDSLVLVVQAQEQARLDNLYNDWYKNQPVSTQKAAQAIAITEAELWEPNSAGGCDYCFYYSNKSTKKIKYLYWTGTVYNAVNDPVYCEIRRTSTFSGKDTGPIASGESGGGCWDCIIYNYSADTLRLSNINIIYMDGSSINIAASDIRRLISAPSTDVYISTYDVAKMTMSDATCSQHISMWQGRLNKLHGSYVSQTLYDDHAYDIVWLCLQSIKSEASNVKAEVQQIQLEIDDFEKFVNFEDNSYKHSTYPYSNSTNTSLSNTKKHPFVTFGIEGSIEGLKSFSTGWGLSVRIGRFNSLFNSTIGIKYQYAGYKKSVSYSYTDYDSWYGSYVYSYADYKHSVNQIVFPVILNCNILRRDNYSLYMGVGYEFGVLLSDKYQFEYGFGDNFSENDFYKYGKEKLIQLSVPCRNVVLQVGFAGRHCDWKIYCKIPTYKTKLYNMEPCAVGTALVYYF